MPTHLDVQNTSSRKRAASCLAKTHYTQTRYILFGAKIPHAYAMYPVCGKQPTRKRGVSCLAHSSRHSSPCFTSKRNACKHFFLFLQHRPHYKLSPSLAHAGDTSPVAKQQIDKHKNKKSNSFLSKTVHELALDSYCNSRRKKLIQCVPGLDAIRKGCMSHLLELTGSEAQ